jgi:hypothetical protein
VTAEFSQDGSLIDASVANHACQRVVRHRRQRQRSQWRQARSTQLADTDGVHALIALKAPRD